VIAAQSSGVHVSFSELVVKRYDALLRALNRPGHFRCRSIKGRLVAKVRWGIATGWMGGRWRH
jgi:hypothetical protein